MNSFFFLNSSSNGLFGELGSSAGTLIFGAFIILMSVSTILYCFHRVFKLSEKLEALLDDIITEKNIKIARLAKKKKSSNALAFIPRSSLEVVIDKSKLTSTKSIPQGDLLS